MNVASIIESIKDMAGHGEDISSMAIEKASETREKIYLPPDKTGESLLRC